METFDYKLVSVADDSSLAIKRESDGSYTFFLETRTRLFDYYNQNSDKLLAKIESYIDMHDVVVIVKGI